MALASFHLAAKPRFIQVGLIMGPNRARMSDELLEELVFMKCDE